jgi:hypothetical protein
LLRNIPLFLRLHLCFCGVMGKNGQVTSTFRIVLLALLSAPCLASAQSSTVNAAFDPGTYKPLDGAERWQRWVREDGGSGAIHIQSLASAAYLQAIDDPAAWGRTTGGFLRRAGSSYGSNLIQNSVHESMAAVAGTDPRYFAATAGASSTAPATPRR